MWCWGRLLRVPWSERSNQSVPEEINLEHSLEGLTDADTEAETSINTLAT